MSGSMSIGAKLVPPHSRHLAAMDTSGAGAIKDIVRREVRIQWEP